MEREDSNLALIAIFVSRFEAFEIASMLRGYDLHVHIDAEAPAGTIYHSMAFGGHWVRVFRDDYGTASEIFRGCGASVMIESRALPN